MIHTLKQVWKLAKEVDIVIVEDNFFVFKFATGTDRDRVIDGSPWSFDKHMLLLQNYDSNLLPEDYVFQSASFWVRVYNLPLGRRNVAMAEKIGRKIGVLKVVDVSMVSERWARFLRILVELDISKPLRWAILIRDPQGKGSDWMRLKYERLLIFCTLCGLLGHGGRDCERREDENDEDKVQQYGEWMHALPMKWKPRYSGGTKIIKFDNNGESNKSTSGGSIRARRALHGQVDFACENSQRQKETDNRDGGEGGDRSTHGGAGIGLEGIAKQGNFAGNKQRSTFRDSYLIREVI